MAGFTRTSPQRWLASLSRLRTPHRCWDALRPSLVQRVGSPVDRQTGHVRDARVDRTAKGGEGVIGAAIDVPRANGSPFHPTTPALSAATISKNGLLPSPRSGGPHPEERAGSVSAWTFSTMRLMLFFEG